MKLREAACVIRSKNAGTAYRFNAYHVMENEELAPLFPVQVEDI